MKQNYTTKSNAEITGCSEVRKPASIEVADFAQQLSIRAKQLAERAEGTLHPVMTSALPRQNAVPGENLPAYPPLFSDLRNSFLGIADALDSIENALSRTEL